MMNQATWMMVIVSGGFAALAMLALAWSLLTGQWRGHAEAATIPLLDDGADAGPREV